jgi:imidazolonepropionase-like amidohydrolase
VDSIEHGHEANREDLEMMKEKGTFLVPTVGVIAAMMEAHKNDTLTPEQRKRREAFLQAIQETVSTARRLGVKIASGFDASHPEGQGKNADELVGLVKLGMPPIEAIRAATVNAAELLSWQEQVGALEPGHFADVIAVDGDPLADISVLRHVKFVMKGGAVVKDERSSQN